MNKKNAQQQILRWKRITLVLAVFAGLLILTMSSVAGFYYWAQTNPFDYNDYAAEHQWLPMIQEPKLTVFNYGNGDDVFLDHRADENFLVYNFERDCWEYYRGCIATMVQLYNSTKFTYHVFFEGKPNMEIYGDYTLLETQEDGLVYRMGPGAGFRMLTPDDENSDILIIYFESD